MIRHLNMFVVGEGVICFQLLLVNTFGNSCSLSTILIFHIVLKYGEEKVKM
jgi:hypothetical protein